MHKYAIYVKIFRLKHEKMLHKNATKNFHNLYRLYYVMSASVWCLFSAMWDNIQLKILPEISI